MSKLFSATPFKDHSSVLKVAGSAVVLAGDAVVSDLGRLGVGVVRIGRSVGSGVASGASGVWNRADGIAEGRTTRQFRRLQRQALEQAAFDYAQGSPERYAEFVSALKMLSKLPAEQNVKSIKSVKATSQAGSTSD